MFWREAVKCVLLLRHETTSSRVFRGAWIQSQSYMSLLYWCKQSPTCHLNLELEYLKSIIVVKWVWDYLLIFVSVWCHICISDSRDASTWRRPGHTPADNMDVPKTLHGLLPFVETSSRNSASSGLGRTLRVATILTQALGYTCATRRSIFSTSYSKSRHKMAAHAHSHHTHRQFTGLLWEQLWPLRNRKCSF